APLRAGPPSAAARTPLQNAPTRAEPPASASRRRRCGPPTSLPSRRARQAAVTCFQPGPCPPPGCVESGPGDAERPASLPARGPPGALPAPSCRCPSGAPPGVAAPSAPCGGEGLTTSGPGGGTLALTEAPGSFTGSPDGPVWVPVPAR